MTKLKHKHRSIIQRCIYIVLLILAIFVCYKDYSNWFAKSPFFLNYITLYSMMIIILVVQIFFNNRFFWGVLLLIWATLFFYIFINALIIMFQDINIKTSCTDIILFFGLGIIVLCLSILLFIFMFPSSKTPEC